MESQIAGIKQNMQIRATSQILRTPAENVGNNAVT